LPDVFEEGHQAVAIGLPDRISSAVRRQDH
jgi:hypothetical protein